MFEVGCCLLNNCTFSPGHYLSLQHRNKYRTCGLVTVVLLYRDLLTSLHPPLVRESNWKTHTKAGRRVQIGRGQICGRCETYSCRGSPCALGGRVGSSVVHDVRAGTAADYLPPRHVHAHASAAPSPVVGHAVRSHHGGHL